MQEGLVRLGNPPLRNDVFIQGSSLKKEEEEGKRQQQQQENKKNGHYKLSSYDWYIIWIIFLGVTNSKLW